MPTVSFPRHLGDLAAAAPDRASITDEQRTITRSELIREAGHLAQALTEQGVTADRFVTIALPNGIPFLRAMVACWQVGAIPQPVSSRLPSRELESIIDLADPAVVVGVDPDHYPEHGSIPIDWEPPAGEPAELPDIVSPSWKAPTSGGSTGQPKLIVHGEPAALDPEERPRLVIRRDGCLVMPGPLYHNGPLSWSVLTLLAGGHVVVTERFDAGRTLSLIDEHRADMVYLVPTMMRRIWRLGPDELDRYDLSSLRAVWHLAEPCPAWLKEAWIDWLGPERIWELYAGTENQASTVIRGDEWLEHRGSVGRVSVGELSIRDEHGDEVPPGTTGEVYLRRSAPGESVPTYRYLGAQPKTLDGGWESLGDMGSLDADGFLYLADRASDMILTGGANIYPAEIEAALDEHPMVESSAVIGLPDDDLGNVAHAIVQADPAEVSVELLRAHLAERLVRYKIPRTFEFCDTPLRDDAGKVRRSALRAARLAT